MQSGWAERLRPSLRLEDCLSSYFATGIIRDAACTSCSLRATLKQAGAACFGTGGPSRIMAGAHRDPEDVNGSVHGECSGLSRVRSGSCCTVSGGSRGPCGEEDNIAGAMRRRLDRLLEVGCPLPECEYRDVAEAAGLQWQERRAPLITRAAIGRMPQVRTLGTCLSTPIQVFVLESTIIVGFLTDLNDNSSELPGLMTSCSITGFPPFFGCKRFGCILGESCRQTLFTLC